jgi:hypothetical protein
VCVYLLSLVVFLGLPPFFPFSLAALAFALEVTEPRSLAGLTVIVVPHFLHFSFTGHKITQRWINCEKLFSSKSPMFTG